MKEGAANAALLLAYVEQHKCVEATRIRLALHVGLTPKQLRRATERLVAEGKIWVRKSCRRYGGPRRAVGLVGWDPGAGRIQ